MYSIVLIVCYCFTVQIDREYKMMSALYTVGFPVPQPIHYCNSPDVIGTEFYLMEYVQVSIFAFDCLMCEPCMLLSRTY